MDVSEMLTLVANVSVNEDEPDSVLTARHLRYLNLAYNRIWTRIAKANGNILETTQSVTVTSGAGTLSPVPYKVQSVVDTTNGNILEFKNPLWLEEQNPDLDDTGTPKYCYISGSSTLNVYPSSSITARVRYMPQITELTSSTTSANISLPAEHHQIIPVGALMWIFLDERDARSEAEISRMKFEYRELMGELLDHLSTNGTQPNRVEYHDF